MKKKGSFHEPVAEGRKMIKLVRIMTLSVATLVYSHTAIAELNGTGAPQLMLNGFGTLGVIHTNEDQADFVSNPFSVPDGAGYSHAWSPEVDSRLGLQLTSNLTPRLTGVLQFIAEQRYDDRYTPSVEWANLKYDITPDMSVRVGRMLQPSFLVSEYRKVGYATPWVRPPEEVYNLVPVTNFDGVDLSYRSHFDGFTNTLRGAYGRKDVSQSDGGTIEARGFVVLSDTLVWETASLYMSYTRTRVTFDTEDLNILFNGLSQFGSEGEAIVERYGVDNRRFEIVALGGHYDPGDWFVMAEFAHSNSRTYIGDSRGWYVSGGYKFGVFTPYVTLARAWVDSETSDPGVSLDGLPPATAAQADELNSTLNMLLGSAAQQKSVTLGARWDFARSVAVKVQYERLDLDEGSPGVLINIQPGFEPGGRVDLFSVSLDFVF